MKKSIVDDLADARWRLRHLKRILDDREKDLAERLVKSGPKAWDVSASETHEISAAIVRAFKVLRLGKFKGWILRSWTEDHQEAESGLIRSWEKVLETKRYQRIAGCHGFQFFRVYRKAKAAP